MTKRFPRAESDIATLAVRVIDGLTNAAEDFPAPPFSSEELRGKLDAFKAADTATVAGETRDIAIVSEGDTWVILRWKQPVDGGSPTFYRIQRQQEGAPWEDAGTATNTEQLMSNQPRGVELYYRVIAVNKAGGGPTVTLVL